MASKRLCIILARGGSKRLPGKNTKLLAGKPLIAHSVEQALEAGVFTTVVVSSDSDEILQAAKDAGATVSKRPQEFATDEASSLDVITHYIKQDKQEYDVIVLLQPTSPLRLAVDIKKAVAIFDEKFVASVISVTKAGGDDKNLVPAGMVSGDYKFNGAVYVWNAKEFLNEPKIIYANTRLMEMPELRSVDIDYDADFEVAEAQIKSGEYKQGEAKALN